MRTTLTVETFSQKYNQYAPRTACERVALFYSLILDAMDIDAFTQNSALAIVKAFVERIRLVDELIDRKNVSLSLAFSVVFPEFRSTQYIEHDAACVTGEWEHDYGRPSRALSLSTTETVNQHNNTCQATFDAYVQTGLQGVFEYGEKEIDAHRDGIHSEAELEHLLVAYNCDFYLYNAIVFDFLALNSDKQDASRLQEILTHYLVLDGILDSLCDVFDDVAAGGFNFLTSWHRFRNTGDLRFDLWSSGIFHIVYDIAKKHYLLAADKAVCINNTRLKEVLACFVEGAWQSVSIAREHEFFIGKSSEQLSDVERLVFKPHPWEIIDAQSVFAEQTLRLQTIEQTIGDLFSPTCKPPVRHDTVAEAASVAEYYAGIRNVSLDKDIILLHTPGCSKALRENRKCHHCGARPSFATQATTQAEVLQSFHKGLAVISSGSAHQIGVYSNGSFFDDAEVAPDTRIEIIASILARSPDATIIVESHPRYVVASRLQQLRNAFPDLRLTIGMGFDSGNEFFRNVVLRKDISERLMESALRSIRAVGFQSLAYACLKPPFMTEREAIADCISTGRYLLNIGVETVSVEPLASQPGTLQAFLFADSDGSVPWLWSAMFVANALAAQGRVLIGGQVFLPIPTDVAHNCAACTGMIREAIAEYNTTQSVGVLQSCSCECFHDWRQVLSGCNNSSVCARMLDSQSQKYEVAI